MQQAGSYCPSPNCRREEEEGIVHEGRRGHFFSCSVRERLGHYLSLPRTPLLWFPTCSYLDKNYPFLKKKKSNFIIVVANYSLKMSESLQSARMLPYFGKVADGTRLLVTCP